MRVRNLGLFNRFELSILAADERDVKAVPALKAS
jgi:hypothetical protein